MTVVYHTHDWRPTGHYRVHADIGKQRQVWFLRCAICDQDGFRRGGSAVRYTWTKDETQWEVA